MIDNLSGEGVAIRRKDDPPIPGEPFVSIEVAREVQAKANRLAVALRMIAEGVADPSVFAESILRREDLWGHSEGVKLTAINRGER